MTVPARNALQYQVTEMYTREDNPNPFMGMTDASDEAWHSLMERKSNSINATTSPCSLAQTRIFDSRTKIFKDSIGHR